MQQRHEETSARLIAKVLRDVLATETFTTYADLSDALKCRLARLRIPWTTGDLVGAERLVESNRPLLKTPCQEKTIRREDSIWTPVDTRRRDKTRSGMVRIGAIWDGLKTGLVFSREEQR